MPYRRDDASRSSWGSQNCSLSMSASATRSWGRGPSANPALASSAVSSAIESARVPSTPCAARRIACCEAWAAGIRRSLPRRRGIDRGAGEHHSRQSPSGRFELDLVIGRPKRDREPSEERVVAERLAYLALRELGVQRTITDRPVSIRPLPPCPARARSLPGGHGGEARARRGRAYRRRTGSPAHPVPPNDRRTVRAHVIPRHPTGRRYSVTSACATRYSRPAIVVFTRSPTYSKIFGGRRWRAAAPRTRGSCPTACG